MPVRILHHTRTETRVVSAENKAEAEAAHKGWKLVWEQDLVDLRETPPDRHLSEWTRELPDDPKGFRVTTFWPDGGESGHDTFATFIVADNWRDAVLEAVEEMNESEPLEEGDHILFDDAVPYGSVDTGEGVNRHAVVVWKDGKAQWLKDELYD